MREGRFLALMGFLLVLVGGLLVILEGSRLPRNFDLGNLVLATLIPITLGIAAVVSAAVILRGTYGSAGALALVLGILVLILGYGLAQGLILLVGGVLELVAAGMEQERRQGYYFYRR